MHIVELATILFTGSMAAFSRKFSRHLIISIPDRKIALISRMGWSPGCIRLPWVSHPSEPCRNLPDCRAHPATYPLWISAVSGPGPANPLGTRWIGLSQRGDRIHGTNNQS